MSEDLPVRTPTLQIETFTFDEEEQETDLATVQTKARDRLAKLVPLAIDALSTLALGAEKEQVQLAAAEAILDRSGLARGSTLAITTSRQEHDQATEAALALVSKLDRNRRQLPILTKTPELETLVVLEGDVVTLPEKGAIPGTVIETTATE